MSRNQRRKLFCVWDNNDDSIIAIDQTSDVCAALMGIGRDTFFSLKARMKKRDADAKRRWTIIDSRDIEESEDIEQ